MVLESGVLRETVGARREEVIGRWRKLQNEEPRDWYFPSNIIRMSDLTEDKMSGACRPHSKSVRSLAYNFGKYLKPV